MRVIIILKRHTFPVTLFPAEVLTLTVSGGKKTTSVVETLTGDEAALLCASQRYCAPLSCGSATISISAELTSSMLCFLEGIFWPSRYH